MVTTHGTVPELTNEARAQLVDENRPAKLYWYRSLAGERWGWAQEVVLGSIFYLSAPSRFNDLFEFKCRLNFNVSRERKVAFFRKELIKRGVRKDVAQREAEKQATPAEGWSDRRFESHMENHLEASLTTEYREDAGVLCLTRLHLNPLMWAHYADQHRGICLEFDTTVAPERNPLCEAHPVRYQRDYPTLNFFEADAEERVTALCLTKSTDWEYEQEWRYVLLRPADEAPRRIPYPPEALTGVLLGHRISDEHQEKVCEWAAHLSHTIEVNRVGPSEHRYVLEKQARNRGTAE